MSDRVKRGDAPIEAPSTEAGQQLAAAMRTGGWHESYDALILAIEQQARDEGRREAVRSVAGDIEMLRSAGGRADGWVHISEVALHGIFDGVAGLNASESRPTRECGHEECDMEPCLYASEDWEFGPAIRVGDESGQKEQSDE